MDQDRELEEITSSAAKRTAFVVEFNLVSTAVVDTNTVLRKLEIRAHSTIVGACPKPNEAIFRRMSDCPCAKALKSDEASSRFPWIGSAPKRETTSAATWDRANAATS
jgi:hypothetical protein